MPAPWLHSHARSDTPAAGVPLLHSMERDTHITATSKREPLHTALAEQHCSLNKASEV